MSENYRVLARKYRPHSFDDLIGQEVLVRTLTNAFTSGRIAHAFLLTGIRGIGKTTTARIIARGLNCEGPDGTGGPTTSPCGECPNCKMILDDCHVDVIEMDAASNTGVDNMRDIIDTVHYAPASARYKVYIIDEVHMLSKSAFNALLKTLEEPPAHVKFIFATTELRKIPVTIVSRCQRFDLKRLDVDMLTTHLTNITHKESVSIDEEGLKLIANAAEGSVRDALSLTDQAIAIGEEKDGTLHVNADAIRDMLGLADKTQSFALLNAIFAGEAQTAIGLLRELYGKGADPQLLMQDLLELVHFTTRVKLSAQLADDIHYGHPEQESAKQLASALAMPALTRAWQMLLKGVQELRQAPSALAAAEMVLIRLCYASTLPSPGELVAKWEKGGIPAAPATQSASTSPAPSSAPAANLALAVKQEPVALQQAAPQEQAEPLATPQSYLEVVELFETEKEMILASHLSRDLRLVAFTKGVIELRPIAPMGADIAARLARHLSDWTGERWRIHFSEAEGEPTLHEQTLAEKREQLDYARAHPDIQQIMNVFPGAELLDFTPDGDE